MPCPVASCINLPLITVPSSGTVKLCESLLTAAVLGLLVGVGEDVEGQVADLGDMLVPVTRRQS